jgi:uncharacterized protein (TIGR02646 family)
MIRIKKSEDVPQSLVRTTAYDGVDVQRQLLVDHHKKCYICECIVEANYHIEHLNSKNNNRQDWNNLFLSCGYCNVRKLGLFDDILNPTMHNVEDIIEQRIDTSTKTASFKSNDTSMAVTQTIRLLERIFNGKDAESDSRNPHEEVFYDKVEMIINGFMKKAIDFCMDSSDVNMNCIKEELNIDKEFLGFKYWIIRDTPQLFAAFKDDIKWNKQ